MKRSEVNALLREAESLVQQRGFYLPPFARWSLPLWERHASEVAELVECQLGWDITDFGCGNFRERGLILFTLRNGRTENLKDKVGKVYAEKLLCVNVNQVTPFHFHWTKTEDIINRGGGLLLIQLCNSTQDELLDITPVHVRVDAIERQVEAHGIISLEPGESITLSPRLYHKFWAEKGQVLAGEVSVVNDDRRDNRFLEPIQRFASLEEDVPPLYLLCTDYPRFRHHTG